MDNNIDYGAVFELDEGAKEQGAAAPETEREAGAQDAQGAEEQGAAAPAGDDDTQTDAAEKSGTGGPNAEGQKGPGGPGEGTGEKPRGSGTEGDPSGAAQPPEERAAFAAARRKAERERDAAIAKAKEDAQRIIDEAFAASGLTNPYTNKPITSKAEFDEYRRSFEDEKREQILKKTGMSDDEFKRYVDTLPEVRQAKAAKAEAEEARRQAQEREAERRVSEQLKEIGALDPSIRTLEDIGKQPNYPEFYERVKRGMTLVEAYKLTNYDALTKGAAAAGRQAALNAAAGKDHLTPTAQRGGGGASVPVPAEVKEIYRELVPEATDAEILAHYNRGRKTERK